MRQNLILQVAGMAWFDRRFTDFCLGLLGPGLIRKAYLIGWLERQGSILPTDANMGHSSQG